MEFQASIADGLRRLSSHDATRESLSGGQPTIVVPADQLHNTTGEAIEVAESLELARHNLKESELSLTLSRTRSAQPSTVTDKYAFAFDIDGVLIRGGKPIPEAVEAMKVLNGKNEFGIKIPYIFVTNGGGKSESDRCLQLSKQLNLEVSPGQFICGHTPMREMAERYNTVLVVGGSGEACRKIFEGYGFKDVITPGDIMKDNQHTSPFRQLNDQELSNSRLRNYGEVKIDAIFVAADSLAWQSDIQIITDLLTSKDGYIGTKSEDFTEKPSIPLFFSHNDLVWATEHDHTRLGMGALRLSIEAMYKGVTGKELEATSFGKPQVETFEFATRLLQQWRNDTHGIDAPPETVYFVGDTPESDIRGSNQFNERADNEWYSILVETGVYQPGTVPKHAPKATCGNVWDAVNHAIKRESEKTQRRQSTVMYSDTGFNDTATHAIDWASNKSAIAI